MIIGFLGLLVVVGVLNIKYYQSWVYRRPKVFDFTGYRGKVYRGKVYRGRV